MTSSPHSAATPPDPSEPLFNLPKGQPMKLVALLALLVVLQVPLWMVSGLIAERSERQDDVLAGYKRGWGPAQVVAGPTLIVPYGAAEASNSKLSEVSPGSYSGWARLQPSSLKLDVQLQPETRQRGLFRAEVYTAKLAVSGTVTLPQFALPGRTDLVADWSRARMVLGLTDPRGVSADAQLQWDGHGLPFQPEAGVAGCEVAVLGAPLALTGAPGPDGAAIAFSTAVTLRGTQRFDVVPLARQTALQVSSPWPTPSFTGANLPLHQEHDAAGFRADWEEAGPVASLGWQPVNGCTLVADVRALGSDNRLGVELQQAVPTNLMVQRASKYGTLFVALSFLTLFLFEATAKVRVHLVQYGLIGLSMSLFALLLVSVAEPCGFAVGYVVSAAAVLVQASLYALSVLRRTQLVLMFAGLLAALFAFLYVLLSLETYALLTGSVALFVLLSAIMLATRRVGWDDAPV